MTDTPPPSQHAPEPPASPEEAGLPEPAALPASIPSTDPEEPPPPPPPPPPGRARTSLVPWVYALGAVVLGWAVMFLWLHPVGRGPTPGEAQRVDTLTAQVQSLSDQVKQLAQRPAGQPQAIQALQQQVNQLAARQPPAPPDIAPLQRKVAQLDQQLAAMAKAPTSATNDAGNQPVAALSQRVAAIEQSLGQRQGAVDSASQQVSQLGQAVSSLRQQVSQISQTVSQVSQDQQALADQMRSLRNGQADAQNGLSRRIDSEAADIADLRNAVRKVQASTSQGERVMRVAAAFAALDAGRPLGDIQGAPPAVARFAHEPPPTLASLRQSFPAAAQAALAVSRPSTEDKPFLDRVWTRAQGLVTVRQGDKVIVGDPAAGIIAHARAALDAGDLSGAVQALDALSGQPAQAVAAWVQQAKQLLAARAGLFALAGQGQ